jgi:putative DNA primase/helicase
MKPETRCDEALFWREFEQVRPRILGPLLDAVSADLRNLPNLRLDRLPRMADFALWINACEGSLGMRPGEALATYSANRAETRELALESSPLYEPIAKLAREGFNGTVAELFVRLNGTISEGMRRSVRWPKAPSALGTALRRMASNLRSAGIEIRFSRADHSGRRLVSLICGSEPGKRLSVAVSDRQ